MISIGFPQLILVVVVFLGVPVHQISPGFLRAMVSLCVALVDLATDLVDLRREEGLGFSIDSFLVLLFLPAKLRLFAVVAHVLELAIDEINLLVRETEGFSVDQLFQHLELVDDQGLAIVVDAVLDLVQVLTQYDILERVGASLLGSQVQNSATHLEQVLGDVLRLTAELAGICVDVKMLPLLLEKGIDLQRLLHYALLTDEVQLVEHVNEVDLVRLLNLLLDDLTKLGVELLDQKGVAAVVDVLHHSLIRTLVSVSICLIHLDLLSLLLVHSLLMKHVECSLLVTRAHHARLLVDCR